MGQILIEVNALDAGNGYVIKARSNIAGDRQEVNEHRATEAEVQARLATLWQWWAGQVDSE